MKKNDRSHGRRDERASGKDGGRAASPAGFAHRGQRPDPLAAKRAEQKAAIEHEPQRTCIITKKQLPPAELLRLAWAEGQLIPGPKGGGRGAYIKVAREVFAQLDAKVLSRAFREQVRDFDRAQFLNDLHKMAERRVLEAVGLARRTGILVTGTDNVPANAHDGVLLLADDLAARSSGKFGAPPFVSGAALGQAAGMGYVGAALIPGKTHHITNEAAYWLAVWYESDPRGPGRSREQTGTEGQNEASHE
ncbi:MAG: DUF448 domain-containing protein [Myxococcota bacterium]